MPVRGPGRHEGRHRGGGAPRACVRRVSACGARGPRATGDARPGAGRAAGVDADVQGPARDARAGELVDGLGRQAVGDVDEREAAVDVDAAHVLAGEAALAGERPDERTRLQAVAVPDGHAVARVAAGARGRRAPPRPGDVTAAGLLGARLARVLHGAVQVLAVGRGDRTVVAHRERGDGGEQVDEVDARVRLDVLAHGVAHDLEASGGDAVGGLAEQGGGAVGADLRGRRDGDLGERRAGGPLDLAQARALGGRDERQRLARAARAAGAPDAVHVGLGLARQVEVDDQADALDVEPARGDVGRDEDVELARAQPFDDPLAVRLRDVARDVGRGDAALHERVADLLGVLAGADEHDRRLGLADGEHARERAGLVAERHHGVRLADGLDRRRLARDGHRHGVDQVLVGDAADLRGHRRGEERDLAARGGPRQDAVDVLGEAHAQHLVGLVEHEELDVGELERAAVDVVDDAARRAHDDLGAAREGALLRQVRRAAVHRDDLQAVDVGGERRDRVGDLHRELTRRRQHDHLHGGEGRVDALQQRQAERRGLAGARLGDADDVAAREQRGDRAGLHRGRRGEAEARDGGQDVGGQAQVGERAGLGGRGGRGEGSGQRRAHAGNRSGGSGGGPGRRHDGARRRSPRFQTTRRSDGARTLHDAGGGCRLRRRPPHERGCDRLQLSRTAYRPCRAHPRTAPGDVAHRGRRPRAVRVTRGRARGLRSRGRRPARPARPRRGRGPRRRRRARRAAARPPGRRPRPPRRPPRRRVRC